MDEAEAAEARYWCHMCSQMVNPIVEVEMIKCPLCLSGFVEEMNSTTSSSRGHNPFSDDYNFGGSGAGGGERGTDLESDRALSLWAPVLLGMMRNPRRRRRLRRRFEFADEDYYDEDESSEHNSSGHREGETELDRELESIIRRRRRSSATILQLLHGIRAGMLSESDNSESESRDTNDIRDRERVILINPFNQTIIVQGSSGSSYDTNNPQPQNRNPIGSLGDYFIGPGLELLLQHLAENDPNRYGTAPAQKESVEAMPTVKIKEILQCSVCLEDFEVGTEAKEMPCNHKFHSGCILPWLELHSSCPVCRYQLPSDESKLDMNLGGSRNNNSSGESNNANDSSLVEEVDGNGRRFSVPLPWPLSSLFSASGNGNSSSTASASSTNASTDASRTNEN